MDNPRGVGQQIAYPHIPLDSWRRDAECARTDSNDRPLYDARMWDSPSTANRTGTTTAKRICNTRCKVRAECADAYDWRYDEGVWGGHKTPPRVRGPYSTEWDKSLAKLLRTGVPLDEAVRVLQRAGKKAG